MTVSISTALRIGLQLIAAGQRIAELVGHASDAGRETLSQEEWTGMTRIHDDARADAHARVSWLLTPPESENSPPAGAGGPSTGSEQTGDARGAGQSDAAPGGSGEAGQTPAGDPPPAGAPA